MGSGAQEGGGAGDGQGQAHHREGHDHIESPVEQDRHFLSPFPIRIPADPGPLVLTGQRLDITYLNGV